MISSQDALIISFFGLVVFGFFYYSFVTYNRLIILKNNISKAWSNIDVSLKQRHNEIPNLVNTVKSYMSHEKDLLENITKARNFLKNSEVLSEKAAANEIISESLKSLFAVVENYPDLKAIDTFKHLQERITGLENEIADRRELYNDSVTIFNTQIQSFPVFIIAKIMRLKIIDLFKATAKDKELVKIKL